MIRSYFPPLTAVERRAIAIGFVTWVAFGTWAGVLAMSASGQTTTSPGVDCSLLTPTQAQGLVCATPPKSDPSPAPSEADCSPYPNPYAEPDRAARCAAWITSQLPPPPPLPTFDVGRTYVHPYPSIRMRVLAVTASLEGVPVVTAQFVAGPDTGQVFAFRVDLAVPWQPAP